MVVAATVQGATWNDDVAEPDHQRRPLTSRLAYDPTTGLLASTTQPDGQVEALAYDDWGRPTRRELRGGAETLVWTWRYGDDHGPDGRAPGCGIAVEERHPSGQVITRTPLEGGAPGERCRIARIERSPPEPGQAPSIEQLTYAPSGPLRGKLLTRALDDLFVETWTYQQGLPTAEHVPGKGENFDLGWLARHEITGPVPDACTAEAHRSTAFENDLRGNPVRVTEEGAEPLVVEQRFDSADRNVESVIDPGGLRLATSVAFDAFDRPRRVVDRGLLTEHFYDPLGRPIGQITQGIGRPEIYVESMVYDGADHLVARATPGPGVDASELTAAAAALRGEGVPPLVPRRDAVRGPAWRLERLEYDARGLLLSHENTDGVAPEAPFRGRIHTRWFYDAGGRPVLYDPGRTDRAVRIRTTWDALGRLLTTEDHEAECPEPMHVVAHVPDDAGATFHGSGQPLRAERRGTPGRCEAPTTYLREDMVYDDWGRLIRAEALGTVPEGLTDTPPDAPRRTWTWRYDTADRLVVAGLASGALRADEHTAYTPQGEVCRAARTTDEATREEVTALDDRGRAYRITERHLRGDLVLAEGIETRTVDVLGRTVRREDGTGLAFSMAYDAQDRLVALDAPERRVQLARDGLGRVTLELEQEHVSGRTRAIRRTWGSEHPVEEQVEVDEAPFLERRFAYDVGDALVRLDDNRRQFNEVGDLIEETTPDGVARSIARDARGQMILLETTWEGAGAAPMPLPAVIFERDAAGHVVRARTFQDQAIQSEVVRRYDSLGSLLEEATTLGEETRLVRARPDALGKLARLYLPGAQRDTPDLLFTHDASGRLLRIETPESTRYFQSLDHVTYTWAGDLVATRLVQLRSGAAWRTENHHDRALGLYRVRHAQVGAEGLQTVLESRRYWYGEHVAAQWTSPRPEDAATRLDDALVGGQDSRLAQRPRGLEAMGLTYQDWGALGLPSTLTIYDRDGFGDIRRSQTLGRSRSGGMPQITTTWRTIDRGRVTREQTLTWRTNANDPFEAGRPGFLHDVQLCFAGDPPPCPAANGRRDLATGTRHALALAGPRADYPSYPMPPGELPSQRGFTLGYTRGGLLQAYDDDDPGEPTELLWDGLDRLALATHRFDDVWAPNPWDERSLLPPPPAATTQAFRWDAFDRLLETTMAPASAVPGEGKRRRIYLGSLHIADEDETAVEGASQTFYVPGADDIPYVQWSFDEGIPLADVDGAWAGYVIDEAPGAQTSVLSYARTARRSVPVVDYGAPSLLAWVVDFAVDQAGGMVGEVIARGSPATEFMPLLPGAALTPTGPTFDLTQNPYEHVELQRLEAIEAAWTLLKEAALVVAALLAPELLPYWAALAFEGLLIARDIYLLYETVDQAGWSVGAVIEGLMIAAPVVGSARALSLRRAPARVGSTLPRPGAPRRPQRGDYEGSACPIRARCLIAGTLVATTAGAVPIETLEPGDLVLAMSERTGEVTPRRVLRTIQTPARPWRTLEVTDDDGRATALGVTPEHPLWTADAGWMPAEALTPGDEVLALGGTWLTVTATEAEPGEAPVYNLEVEKDHTFFVGEAAVWAHNECSATTSGESPTGGVTQPGPDSPVRVMEVPSERPGWRTSTNRLLRARFPWAFTPSGRLKTFRFRNQRGEVTEIARFNRNHVVPNAYITNFVNNLLNGAKTLTEQKRILARLDPTLARFGDDIQSAVKAWRRDRFNDPRNVWVGDALRNQAHGSSIDPNPLPKGWYWSAADD